MLNLGVGDTIVGAHADAPRVHVRRWGNVRATSAVRECYCETQERLREIRADDLQSYLGVPTQTTRLLQVQQEVCSREDYVDGICVG